jgi:TPR repeat protein
MAQAQYDLALMYHYGEGVAVDAKKAFELFKKSAEQGYADAKNNLSVFYERGIGVDKNAEKAQYWREKSR